MSDSYDIYVILEAELEDGTTKQALVLKEAFDSDGGVAGDYFVRPRYAKVTGKVSMVTSGPLLPDVFISD